MEPSQETKSSLDLDSITQGFVRKCARQVGSTPQDREDFEQQLYLKLANRIPADQNDPQWNAFVALAARQLVASVIRNREAAKRACHRCCSIHVQVKDQQGTIELAATLTDSEVPSRRATHRDEEELLDLALDVADLIASLPDPCDREICERLKFAGVSQVARDMRLPRTTLNSRIRRLRCHFEAHGLQKYL